MWKCCNQKIDARLGMLFTTHREMEKAMSEENRDPRVCPKLGDVFRRENGVVMRITAVAEDRIDWTSQDGDHRLKNWHGSRSTWEDFVEVYTKVIHAE